MNRHDTELDLKVTNSQKEEGNYFKRTPIRHVENFCKSESLLISHFRLAINLF